MTLTVTLIIIMTGIIVLVIREIALYCRRRDGYPLRRLTLRLSAAVMLLYLCSAVLIGVRVYGLNEHHGLVGLWMAFWGCVTLLAAAVICLTIADLRLLSHDIGQEAATDRIWRDIAQLIAEHEHEQSQPEQPPVDQSTRDA